MFTSPSLLWIIPTVILFHLFKLDQTAAPCKECVMGSVGMEAQSCANGSSWFERPICEHFMWVMACSLNVPAVMHLATQQHGLRWVDAVNTCWKRLEFDILVRDRRESSWKSAPLWCLMKNCKTATLMNFVYESFRHKAASLLNKVISCLSQSLPQSPDNHTKCFQVV